MTQIKAGEWFDIDGWRGLAIGRKREALQMGDARCHRQRINSRLRGLAGADPLIEHVLLHALNHPIGGAAGCIAF